MDIKDWLVINLTNKNVKRDLELSRFTNNLCFLRLLRPNSVALQILKNTSRAHATPNAHGHHAKLGAAPFHLVDNLHG